MKYSHRSLLLGLSSRRLISYTAALIAAFATSSTLAAQVVQAHYPLSVDLNDTTGAYTPMLLNGTPPPAPPNGGVCINGIYYYATSGLGQDAITPDIWNLDENDFQIEIEFNVAALTSYRSPIFIGGNGWRWIGFQVESDGTFGLLHNNAVSEWSATMITVGAWHAGVIKYEAGLVELYLDGVQVLAKDIGPLDTGYNYKFTTNNYSNGTNLDGCIREVVISNDTTLVGGATVGTPYCEGDGSGTPCPCGNINDGSLPAAGCANGQYASGAMLSGSGYASVTSDSLVLIGEHTENNQSGLYFQANNDLSPGTLWGDGLQCAGGQLKRLGVRFSDAAGFSDTSGWTTPISVKAGNVMAGDTKYYQLWYRNPFNSPCGAEFNASNGYMITWTP